MKDDVIYLRHILDAIGTIDGYLKDVDHDSFLGNHMMQDAVMRELAVIGEAASKIDAAFRSAHSLVPFGKMIGLRNRLIHAYIEVDLEIVWETCQHDLPPLRTLIEKIVTK